MKPEITERNAILRGIAYGPMLEAGVLVPFLIWLGLRS